MRAQKSHPSVLFVGICILLLSVIGGLFFLWSGRQKIDNHYQLSDKAISNPLMGFAPRADSRGVEDWHQLVYVDVYWSELEPKEGEYDWEAIESRYQFKYWRSLGKHAILRFICDYPTKNSHKDIPDWLYEETKDGQYYSSSYGKGYSPNYNNSRFLQALRHTVRAMGERWGSDTFISYIELGVLGHWGEWHTTLDPDEKGGMPNEVVRNRYVRPWKSPFPNAKILMRRPFNIAAQEAFGLFNDVFGDEQETERWLKWIREGGTYDQRNEKNALTAMPSFWQVAPSGGEITSNRSMKEMMISDISTTIQMLRDSHTTFLGPMVADKLISEAGYDEMLKNMGYRFFVKNIDLVSKTKLSLELANEGVAPFYWNWPLNFYVKVGSREVKVDSGVDIRTILPGQSQVVTLDFDQTIAKSWDTVSLGIVDPMTNKDAIHFAIKGMEDKTRLPLISHN